jgi:hypothetical protein
VGKIIVLVVAVQPAPAHAIASCDAQKQLDAREVAGMPPGRPPFAVGDSVMLGAADALAHAGIKVDARGCRSIDDGLSILARRKRRHRLPRVVIVALGTNFAYTRGDTARALRILDPGQWLVLVTPRGDNAADAAAMRRAARRHPHRVCLADWRRFSAGHDEWTSTDGIHLGPAGVRAYVRLLKPYRRITAHRSGPCGGS